MHPNAMKRKVPVTVWVNIFFGGFANLFGWIFFGFGMIFFWIFALNADVSFLVFSGENTIVQGMATDSRETRNKCIRRNGKRMTFAINSAEYCSRVIVPGYAGLFV
ncbi:MAG: hypothetical protein D3922_03605 [Candidatus Electrothrix sp. AR1]|nr:hypothetical protein [Candidatus Electrothrix sp. AR1]